MEKKLFIEVNRISKLMNIKENKVLLMEQPGPYQLVRALSNFGTEAAARGLLKRGDQFADDFTDIITNARAAAGPTASWNNVINQVSAQGRMMDLLSTMRFDAILPQLERTLVLNNRPMISSAQRQDFYRGFLSNILSQGTAEDRYRAYDRIRERLRTDSNIVRNIINGVNANLPATQQINITPGSQWAPYVDWIDQNLRPILVREFDQFIQTNNPATFTEIQSNRGLKQRIRTSSPTGKRRRPTFALSRNDNLLFIDLRQFINTYFQSVKRLIIGREAQIERVLELAETWAKRVSNGEIVDNFSNFASDIDAKLMSLSPRNTASDIKQLYNAIEDWLRQRPGIDNQSVNQVMKELRESIKTDDGKTYAFWDFPFYEASKNVTRGTGKDKYIEGVVQAKREIQESIFGNIRREILAKTKDKGILAKFLIQIKIILKRFLVNVGIYGYTKTMREWRYYIQKHGPWKGGGIIWLWAQAIDKFVAPVIIGFIGGLLKTIKYMFLTPDEEKETTKQIEEFISEEIERLFFEGFGVAAKHDRGWEKYSNYEGFEDFLTILQVALPLRVKIDDWFVAAKDVAVQKGGAIVFFQNIFSDTKETIENVEEQIRKRIDQAKQKYQQMTLDAKKSRIGFSGFCVMNSLVFIDHQEGPPPVGKAYDESKRQNLTYEFDETIPNWKEKSSTSEQNTSKLTDEEIKKIVDDFYKQYPCYLNNGKDDVADVSVGYKGFLFIDKTNFTLQTLFKDQTGKAYVVRGQLIQQVGKNNYLLSDGNTPSCNK